jgi:excisionase family DNA binding protein
MKTITFDQLPEIVAQLFEKITNIESLLLKKNNLPPQSEPADELLAIQSAAAFLFLSVPTVYSKVSKGELPAMKQGNRLYFSKKDLIEYVKLGRKKTATEIESEVETFLYNRKK